MARSIVSGFLMIFFSLFLMSCSAGAPKYIGKTYRSESGDTYIKFINENTMEWKWRDDFHPEEFEYTIEGSRIRAVRKQFIQIVKYFDFQGDKITDDDGWVYHDEKTLNSSK